MNTPIYFLLFAFMGLTLTHAQETITPDKKGIGERLPGVPSPSEANDVQDYPFIDLPSSAYIECDAAPLVLSHRELPYALIFNPSMNQGFILNLDNKSLHPMDDRNTIDVVYGGSWHGDDMEYPYDVGSMDEVRMYRDYFSLRNGNRIAYLNKQGECLRQSALKDDGTEAIEYNLADVKPQKCIASFHQFSPAELYGNATEPCKPTRCGEKENSPFEHSAPEGSIVKNYACKTGADDCVFIRLVLSEKTSYWEIASVSKAETRRSKLAINDPNAFLYQWVISKSRTQKQPFVPAEITPQMVGNHLILLTEKGQKWVYTWHDTAPHTSAQIASSEPVFFHYSAYLRAYIAITEGKTDLSAAEIKATTPARMYFLKKK